MAEPGFLIEAHSYSGGLRHTPFGPGPERPDWAPPADSVGWRDEFELDPADAVVEFHQRQGKAGPVSWLAVYRRSVDAQFGDRSNHAGVGVWLHDLRIADGRSLCRALDRLASKLARELDPEALRGDVEMFASDRYLGAYLLEAAALPSTWTGAPAATQALAKTACRRAVAPGFEEALGRVGEAVTRLSVDWRGGTGTPRTLILVTERADPPADREFADLPPPGDLLADVLEALPSAFQAEREGLRVAAAELDRLQSDWRQAQAAERERLDADRRALERLDGQPATLEGVAMRLNGLSGQMTQLVQVAQLGRPTRPEHKPAERPALVRRSVVMAEPAAREADGASWILWTCLATAVVIAIVEAVVLLTRTYS